MPSIRDIEDEFHRDALHKKANDKVRPLPQEPDGGDTDMTTMVASSGPTGNNAAEQVTPVMPVYKEVCHPFQNYVNVVLPYKKIFFNKTITGAALPKETDVWTMTFRLNTPVDIVTDYTYAIDPAAQADTLTSESTKWERPMYYNYWSTFYRYYTVTHTEYKITLRMRNAKGAKALSVWTYHHGMQGPPTIVYYTGGTWSTVSDQIRGFHRHARCTRFLGSGTEEARNFGKFSNETVIEGEYWPGRYSVQNDIVEDEMAKTWHKIGEVPPLKEACTVIIQNADDSDVFPAESDPVFDIVLDLRHHVQFRDLKEMYDAPSQYNSQIPQINDYWRQTNMY